VAPNSASGFSARGLAPAIAIGVQTAYLITDAAPRSGLGMLFGNVTGVDSLRRVPGTPTDLAVDRLHRTVYVADHTARAGSLLVEGAYSAIVALPGRPGQVAFDPAAGRVYATDVAMGAIDVVAVTR
jgi:DNA-binding beta-propeller fold protein YncE